MSYFYDKNTGLLSDGTSADDVEITAEQAAILKTPAEAENAIASAEIAWAVRELQKHDHGHDPARCTSNVGSLKAYCNAWRDRVINGEIQAGDRPTRPE